MHIAMHASSGSARIPRQPVAEQPHSITAIIPAPLQVHHHHSFILTLILFQRSQTDQVYDDQLFQLLSYKVSIQ